MNKLCYNGTHPLKQTHRTLLPKDKNCPPIIIRSVSLDFRVIKSSNQGRVQNFVFTSNQFIFCIHARQDAWIYFGYMLDKMLKRSHHYELQDPSSKKYPKQIWRPFQTHTQRPNPSYLTRMLDQNQSIQTKLSTTTKARNLLWVLGKTDETEM